MLQIAELGYLGGHSSKEKTYGVMRYLLTNELASQITYCGFKKGKPGFMKFEVHNIAIGKHEMSLTIHILILKI